MHRPTDQRSRFFTYWSAGTVVGLVGLLASGFPVVALQQSPLVPVAPPELQGRPINIVLALDSLGVPWINNQRVPWNELEQKLQAIYSLRPEKFLFLKASPKNPYRALERIVEMAKRRGITVYLTP